MAGKSSSEIEGSVTVTESGAYSVSGRHYLVPIGDGLSIQTGLLHEVCFTEVSPLSHDLSLVLGAVKCADRSVRRLHGRGWERHLKLTVPVYELTTWRQSDVASSLVDVLQYLTGDVWRLDFVKRRRKPGSSGQVPLLKSPNRQRVFIPFSDGLDSYAQTVLLGSRGEGIDVLPVHLRAASTERTMKSLGRAARTQLIPVPVSARVGEPKHAEQSFRTRPFLYDSLAAYAAFLSGGGDVVIPENGQGSLGGSLVRLGAEAPHRSCHPGFTARLARFFERLTGESANFVHPALFRTKGQVLAELLRVLPDSDAWLTKHPSCSYDARHANRDGMQIHCGVCGNCLLRRMSLHAASINDPTPYKMNDLHAHSLEESLISDDVLPSLRAYQDVARNAARSMQRLADQLVPRGGYRVSAEAESLARYQGRSQSESREALENLLEQHSHEWTEFLDFSGKSSWVAQLARG